RGFSDKQMMSGRVAISGRGAGRGLMRDDFPPGELEGVDPNSLKKMIDLINSAENKEKLKDWVGMEDEAKKALEEALKTKAPDDAPKLFSKIYLLFATALIKQADETPGLSQEERMTKYAEAEKYLLEAVRLDPVNAKAWEALSWAQLKQGKYEEAIASASKALALDPNNAKAYYIRAQAIKMLGQLNKARMFDDLKKCAALESAECAKELKEAEEGMRFAPSSGKKGWLGSFLTALMGGAGLLGLYGAFLGLVRLVKKIQARIVLARMSPEERRKHELASAFSSESAHGSAQGAGDLLGGKYAFSHVLSRSGPVELWAAKDSMSGQGIRIKKAFFEGPQDAMAKALFLKEARTLAALRHPNILAARECLDLPQGIHLVFESPPGKDAKQLLSERKRLPLAHVLGVLRPV
ncbi:MAG: tetratricopeptide repeat protein, partial [Elusimicrobiota bacterium]